MKAIILLSGGIDSTVVLALAKSQGSECIAISFDYGQRHLIELKSATAIAQHYNVLHRVIKIDSSCFNGMALSSSLTSNIEVPTNRTLAEIEVAPIPNTYVPARNTLFLAFAVGQAEVNQAQEIHFGPNALDFNHYPDCRPQYMDAYQNLINLATKQAVEGKAPQLITPLIRLDKTEIIRKGMELKVPFDLTWTCYSPKEEKPCERCDACLLRQAAFESIAQI
jgi:7-cyano-7-deazaguanine synthase